MPNKLLIKEVRNERRIQWVFKFQKYHNLEALCQVISSSINFLFLKSGVVIYEIFGECSIVLNSMYLCCIYICLLTFLAFMSLFVTRTWYYRDKVSYLAWKAKVTHWHSNKVDQFAAIFLIGFYQKMASYSILQLKFGIIFLLSIHYVQSQIGKLLLLF